MERNTLFLKAMLQQDWDLFEKLSAEFEQQGKGTPVAIIGTAFHLAVHQRFGHRRSMDDVIRFVADARAFLSEGRDLPAREAEALICATLDMDFPDVEEIIDSLDVGAMAEIEGQLLFKLVSDASPSEEQLDAFLVEAEVLARQ